MLVRQVSLDQYVAVEGGIKQAADTAISVNFVVSLKLQAYWTRPNGIMGRSRGLLHVLNNNEI